MLPYEIHVADRVIHDAEPRGTERFTVAEILSHSSNVGAITLAKLLGPQGLEDWIYRFGFGRKTGIDFPGESPGIVLPLDQWSGSTIGNVPIGQGIAVTPMQMASAYAAIANGGVWRRPHLVDHVSGRPRARIASRRMVSAPIAHAARRDAEERRPRRHRHRGGRPGLPGRGQDRAPPRSRARSGYTTGKYVASFVGFVPASRPRLVILVAVDEPQTVIWGGSVAAPAFSEIAKFALQYLEVPPDAPHRRPRPRYGSGCSSRDRGRRGSTTAEGGPLRHRSCRR